MSTSTRNTIGRIPDSNTSSDLNEHTRTRLNTGMPPVNYAQSGGKHVQMENMSSGSLKSTNSLIAGLLIGGLAAGAYALYRTNLMQRDSLLSRSIAGWLPFGDPITIRKRRTVKVKPSVLYAEWRKLENLPKILSHLKSIEMLDNDRSYWTAKGPAGLEVSWIAEIREDIPGRAISWQAEEDADVPNSGRITFNEKSNGDTLIEVRLTYQPPAGELGRRVAEAFGENPARQIEDDLNRFKNEMEIREAVKR